MTRKLLNRLLNVQGDDGGDSGGGNAPSGGDAIGTGNDARVALLNSIGDSYDEIRAEDLADITDDGSTEPFKVQRADGEQEDLTPPPEEVAAPAPEPEELNTAQMITRKVNGKMVTKSLEEWLVDASKINAADEYLQDAARLRKEALQPELTAQPTKPEVPQLTQEQLAAQRREKLRQRVRAIQMGTEDEAISAFEEMENAVSRPTLTVDDVRSVTDERLKFNTAINEFNKEFNDLVSNPQLHAMVLAADKDLVAKGDRRPYAERYTEIGAAVRKWRDDLITSVAPTPTPAAPAAPASLEQRRVAKAAAPKVPVSASRTAQAPVEDDDAEDVGSVIAAMAKSRGGPQWARG